MKEKIILAGGCFWCTEAVFSLLEGVLKITPGYIGGITENPTYEEVCTGNTHHAEAIEVEFDTSRSPLWRCYAYSLLHTILLR